MENPSTIAFFIFYLFMSSPTCIVNGIDSNGAKKLFWTLSLRRPKQAIIQDALGGPNTTVWKVARADIKSNLGTQFGQVSILNDLITAEPDRNLKPLGRAQGLITSADLRESSLAMNLNFVFTRGE